jgi:alpha-L-fucosidase
MKPQKVSPIFALVLVLVTAVSAQDAVKPTPTSDAAQARTPAQAEFLKWKFGLFLHFNLATFNGQEWANGYEDPLTFAPTNLDCGQWADAAKAAGMKYAVLTVKHTEGYPLWDSASTTHDITAFKNFKDGKGDLVREFVDAFRARGIKIGFYYCAPGNYDNRFGNTLPTNQPSLHGMPPEAQGDYAGFMRQQFTELLTRYGPVDLIWCDQYRVKLKAKEWADLKALIHQLQPNCLVIANNSHKLSETDIYSYEYPIYKNEKGYPPLTNAIPSEVCDTIVDCGNWFWQPGVDAHLRSAEDIVGVLKKCNDRQANYLLDVGPDRTGRIDDAAVKRLQEIGELRRAQGEK